MEKFLYIGCVIILLLGVIAAMWFIPFGRDLEKDNQYLHRPSFFSKEN